MTWMKTSLRKKALVLFAAMALLILALALAACGSSGAGASSNNNDGNSNISTSSQQSTSNSGSSSSSGSSGNVQSADQQVQNAVQGVDGAHNDTGNADATATTENNTPPQP